jgi:hypothetical protein
MFYSSQLPIKLAAPAQRALAGAGIKSLTDFSKFSEQEIANLHGIGKNALTSIKQALVANGIAFAEK